MFEKLNQGLKDGKSGALVIVTKSLGSTPANVGKMMMVFEDASIEGTVGGGSLERRVIEKSLDRIRTGESGLISFDLTKDLNMNCGGQVELFIKVLKPDLRLILVGGGHIAFYLSKMAKLLNYRVIIFDDREMMLTRERFVEAENMIAGNISENLARFIFNENDFVVIATHGHVNDEDALYEVIDKSVKYIGVIGSKRKVKTMFENLIERGVNQDQIKRVHSPVGLNLGGNSPEEIALSILSEMQLVRTGSDIKHMRD